MRTCVFLLGVVLACSECTTQSQIKTDSRSTNLCFGIACDFSGKLTPEQEKGVPPEIRGAFCIESVRNVSGTDIREVLKDKWKKKIAEETHNGVKYFAFKEYRCVDFGKGVSGMMPVIERYRVVDK